MNQFSFNLDQNYLQHDKFGAHYSKNWDKKKQDEYNAWYYKTHKNKWEDINKVKLDIARDNKEGIRDANIKAAKARKEGLAGDEGHYPGYASKQKKLAREYKAYAKGVSDAHRKDADPYIKDFYDKFLNKVNYRYIDDDVNEIREDRSKGINMVKFDIYRAKKKVSSALNKLKNIKL